MTDEIAVLEKQIKKIFHVSHYLTTKQKRRFHILFERWKTLTNYKEPII